MSYDPDALLDRRRLKRRLRIWQGVTLFVVLAGVLTLLQSHGELFRGDRIARLHIETRCTENDSPSKIRFPCPCIPPLRRPLHQNKLPL